MIRMKQYTEIIIILSNALMKQQKVITFWIPAQTISKNLCNNQCKLLIFIYLDQPVIYYYLLAENVPPSRR